jgi:hypothetical protein
MSAFASFLTHADRRNGLTWRQTTRHGVKNLRVLMTQSKLVPFSILDLAPVVSGSSAAESFRRTLELARHAERWGYRRFWLAEYHNMPASESS